MVFRNTWFVSERCGEILAVFWGTFLWACGSQSLKNLIGLIFRTFLAKIILIVINNSRWAIIYRNFIFTAGCWFLGRNQTFTISPCITTSVTRTRAGSSRGAWSGPALFWGDGSSRILNIEVWRSPELWVYFIIQNLVWNQSLIFCNVIIFI